MTQFGLAQPVRRAEEARLLKGNGACTDDVTPPDTLYGWVLRNPNAQATILSIGATRAKSTPGVHGSYTSSDLAADHIEPLRCLVPFDNRDGSKGVLPTHRLITSGTVRHVGDSVAFIVADSVKAA